MKHHEELSGSERRIQILELLRERKEVSVAQLSEKFGVSAMTIRRDLHFYENQGILEMHYGGARLRDTPAPFVSFSKRMGDQHAEKMAIARQAAKQIKENDILFLDTSTTVLLVLDYIPDIQLTIVTNSLPALVALSGRPNIHAIACPGEYQELYGGFMDLTTIRFLQDYHFQKIFLGARLCDPDFGTSCDEEVEAAVKRTVIRQSDRAFLLLDHSKMNGHRFIKFSDVDEFDSIFTDAQLDQTLQNIYAQRGAKLVLC